jgi:pimeloyl-ACP methyl ester carboxylesterase
MSETLRTLESSVRHGYAHVGDVRLHYAESGQGERLVILLHGFPECWYSWRHQLLALGDSYRVVAPDMRGYNLSSKPPEIKDYLLDRLVDDVTGLVRHLGARDAAIVGHDWGAAVAWEVAQKHPEYVWKLAALQVPPAAVWARNVTLKQLLRSWYMFFFQLPVLPEWLIRRDNFAGVEKMLRQTSKRGTFSDADMAIFKSALNEPGAVTAGINYYRANLGPRLRRMLKRRPYTSEELIRIPTLFIYGEKDMAIVAETVRAVSEYVDAPYTEVRLPMSGHWVQQESPSEVNTALLRFLSS